MPDSTDIEVLGAPRVALLLPSDPGNTFDRVSAIVDMMVAKRWERGKSDKALSAHWKTPLSTIQNYSAEAGRFLKRIGETEAMIELAKVNAVRWMAESGKDRVGAARLLLEASGGITQKHEVTAKPWVGTQDELAAIACETEEFRFAVGRLIKELGYEAFGLLPE